MVLFLILNFLAFFLIRVLAKKNIFSKKLTIFFLITQGLILVTTPIRILTRNTSLTSTLPPSLFLASLFLISAALVLIPKVLNFILSEARKLQLEETESTVSIFLYTEFNEMRSWLKRKLKFYDTLEEKLSTFIARVVFKSLFFWGQELLFLVFLVLPWTFWLIFFVYDLANYSFHYSLYFFGFLFFAGKIFSFLLFVAKNAYWNYFHTLYFSLVPSQTFFLTVTSDIFLNFQFILDLMFKPEILNIEERSKEEKINLFQKTIFLVYYFCMFKILHNFWIFILPTAKNFLYLVNFFCLIVCLTATFSLPFSLFLFWLFLLVTFYQYFSLISVNPHGVVEKFMQDLPANLNFYQQSLLKEQSFSIKDIQIVMPLKLFSMPKPLTRLQKFDFFGFFLLFLTLGIFLIKFDFEKVALGFQLFHISFFSLISLIKNADKFSFAEVVGYLLLLLP